MSSLRHPQRKIRLAGRVCAVALWCWMAGVLAACHDDHLQSAIHPAGPAAASINRLWWFLFFLLSAVVTLLLLVIALSLRRRDESEAPMGNTRFVLVSGIAAPTVILIGLLFYSLNVTRALRPRDTQFTIRVIGHRWWWEVHYPDHGFITANEMVIPVGAAVRFELKAADVIHSFWIPNLGGKLDMLPEHWTSYWLAADRPGIFRGQCAEYCGLQHALMAFTVHAVAPEEFEQWVRQRALPAREPDAPLLQRGRDAFFHPDAGCYTCHALRGTSANGTLGPDLTHIGSRPTLGAGTAANTPELLAIWTVDPHAIKPGNRMPPTIMNPDDLEALVAYLSSLR
jgi:cytochrome c oxidase subunit II